MRKSILSILLIATTFIGFAQEKNTKAKALLDQVSEKVNSYDNIFIDFKYSLYNAKENIKQDTRGDVTIAKDKYLFNYLGATRIFNGANTYTIDPDNEEVTIEAGSNQEQDAITPSKMLTFYKKGYRYVWDILQNVKGRKIQYIKLIPLKTEKSEVKSILLGIDVQTKHIYNLIQLANNGTKTTIQINSFKTNQPISKTLFTFDPNKYEQQGYYIIRNN